MIPRETGWCPYVAHENQIFLFDHLNGCPLITDQIINNKYLEEIWNKNMFTTYLDNKHLLL